MKRIVERLTIAHLTEAFTHETAQKNGGKTILLTCNAILLIYVKNLITYIVAS